MVFFSLIPLTHLLSPQICVSATQTRKGKTWHTQGRLRQTNMRCILQSKSQQKQRRSHEASTTSQGVECLTPRAVLRPLVPAPQRQRSSQETRRFTLIEGGKGLGHRVPGIRVQSEPASQRRLQVSPLQLPATPKQK